MADMYDKECPLYAGHPVFTKCRGAQCAFWNYTKKYVPETKEYINDDGYCLVRDFMLSMICKANN